MVQDAFIVAKQQSFLTNEISLRTLLEEHWNGVVGRTILVVRNELVDVFIRAFMNVGHTFRERKERGVKEEAASVSESQSRKLSQGDN